MTFTALRATDDKQSQLKALLGMAIDSKAAELARFGDHIFAHPELGFREERTATCVAQALRDLGLTVEEGLAITGVRAELRGAKPINRSGNECYSVAFFCEPNADTRIECLPECSGAQNPPKYAPIAFAGYLRSRLEPTYARATAQIQA